MSRDLICEKFAYGSISVFLEGRSVRMEFADSADAERAYFVVKNALDLGISVKIRGVILNDAEV